MPDNSFEEAKLYFLTLGCAKNEVDTEQMTRRVEAAGYSITDDINEAHALIVNTCSFIQAATEESLEAIFDLAESDVVTNGNAKIIVSGCLPSRYGGELESELSEVDAFIPCKKEDDIVLVLDKALGISREGTGLLSDKHQRDSSQKPTPASAYVKISDGCDRFCTYCTIPFIRGAYRSFAQADIIKEVKTQIDRGAKEIVLIAQDTGRWGIDLEEPSTLANLLQNLVDSFPSTWFRVMYLQPEGITKDLLEVVRDNDTICSYFDIPLQHCDSDILTSMNRTGSKAEFLEMIEQIRTVVSGATVRTTLITGFPGETQSAFDELCDFVSEAQFDYVGVFPYSREEGTKAALLPDQIDEDDKIERAQAIRDIGDTIGTQRIARSIGQEVKVLVEGCEEDGQRYGRTQGQAPDVDGVVYVFEGQVGDIVTVTVQDSFLYDLEA